MPFFSLNLADFMLFYVYKIANFFLLDLLLKTPFPIHTRPFPHIIHVLTNIYELGISVEQISSTGFFTWDLVTLCLNSKSISASQQRSRPAAA